VKQLTRIERRQARIRRIGDKMVHRPHVEIAELARSPHVHHYIGLTQKHPVHIGSYLHGHQGDLAIAVSSIILTLATSNTLLQNFVSKLKDHLLCRINKSRGPLDSGEETDINTIILKDDRLYDHNIARFNYTTYDVRRAQDVINPRTPHCNVMVLRADTDMCYQGHKYSYGKVLGIYHANVIHIGTRMVDYTPLRMEFLWIRWYEPIDELSVWETSTLDRVRFLPMADEHSFDFLDPADVLRGCHIIPSFASGRKHHDGVGVSACAGDKDDWFEYYVNR
jgi:hypothetical protein